MTVKELIKKLETMPQDLTVAVHCYVGECDALPNKVEVAHIDAELYPKQYQSKEYYCTGDSEAVAVGLKEWVVIRDE